MERLAPVGDVYQAGTLSGNPLATAAGISVLRRLRDRSVYDELERLGARLEAGLAPFGTVQRVGAMLTLFCRDRPVERYEDAAAADTERFAALFRHLLAEGVYLPPSQFECLFPSTAHTDEHVDATVAAARSFFDVGGASGRLPRDRSRGGRGEPALGRCAPDAGRAGADPVFSPLVEDRRFALGVETIYEGYLLHYGRSRLFAPPDDDVALLLGDALLAHGLVRIAETGEVTAVADLAALLSLCAQARADGRDGDGAAWAATAAFSVAGGLDEARSELREEGASAPLERLARERQAAKRSTGARCAR